MSLGMQLLVTALTVIVTVTVTALVNYFLSTPKRLKAQREQEHKEFIQKIDEVENHISDKLQKYDENQKQIKEDITLLKSGSQAIIKNELKLRYEYWLEKKYAPVDAKDDLEKMYGVYHTLGANGVLDHTREQFLNLPDERVVRNKKETRTTKD